ncbi:hypothetical protein [Chryseobacterium sp. 52]|uniref:hypothetical protein n=1 Tax=Chryseobacterium sp. 52 TaxID=2035213 RepID=UPI000C18FF50|nr:hypothetical protein [Chryseobacterium sp. 52]
MIEKYNLLEHIRSRPGMYIGALNDYGYEELLNYLITDFIMLDIYEFTFSLKKDNQLIIEVSGHKTFLPIVNALKDLHNYQDNIFYLSLAGIVALSEFSSFEMNGKCILRSKKGSPEILEDTDDHTLNRIKIEFTPDKEIFKDLIVSYDCLNELFKRFCFLNPQIKIKSIDESKFEKQINFFHYKNGLAEIIEYELKKNALYISPVFKLDFQKDTEFSYSLALAFVEDYGLKLNKIKVYANYKETILGGSLLDGIFQGLKKFFKEESLKRNLKLSVTNAKLRKYLFIYASVKGELVYLGSVKWKLGTPKVQTEIRKFVYDELKLYFTHKDEEIFEILKILQE